MKIHGQTHPKLTQTLYMAESNSKSSSNGTCLSDSSSLLTSAASKSGLVSFLGANPPPRSRQATAMLLSPLKARRPRQKGAGMV